jgi:hypothetical protein
MEGHGSPDPCKVMRIIATLRLTWWLLVALPHPRHERNEMMWTFDLIGGLTKFILAA